MLKLQNLRAMVVDFYGNLLTLSYTLLYENIKIYSENMLFIKKFKSGTASDHLVATPRKIISAGEKILVYDAKSYDFIIELFLKSSFKNDQISFIEATSDYLKLVSADVNGNIIVWDLESFEIIRSLQNAYLNVYPMCLSVTKDQSCCSS